MRRWISSAAFAVSAGCHVALLLALAAAPASPPPAPVEVEIVETPPTPPPSPPPTPASKPVPPSRRREPVIASLSRRVPRRRTPAAPPPPGAAPPANAPPPQEAPVRIGISLSSTVAAGGVALPIGNTLYGKAPEQAPDPASVKPYRAERYAPLTELTTLPQPIACQLPREEYPDEARRLGFEGTVRLRLLIDEQGRVAAASVLRDPGHGLGPAASRSVMRHCRFRPGRRGDLAASTAIAFTVEYELP